MEIWKDIKYYEWLYQISSLGRVKSFPKIWRWAHNGKILKLDKNKYWYLRICLCKDWKRVFFVHRLVAQAFLWLDINNKKILVCHKNETLIDWLLNNSKNNLFLWTHKDNSQDMSKKLRSWMQWKFWKEHHLSKKVNQYTLDWKFIKTWECLSSIKRELWFNIFNISSCCNWKLKTASKFIWKFI